MNNLVDLPQNGDITDNYEMPINGFRNAHWMGYYGEQFLFIDGYLALCDCGKPATCLCVRANSIYNGSCYDCRKSKPLQYFFECHDCHTKVEEGPNFIARDIIVPSTG